jgi:hypothetical protein
MHDAEIGRYHESDAIGLAGGLNTYSYALNNPVKNADPSGFIVQYAVACLADPPCAMAVAAGAAAVAAAMQNAGSSEDNVVPFPGVDPSAVAPIPGPPKPNKLRCYTRYLADLASCVATGICPSGDELRTEECIRRAGVNLRACLSNFAPPYPDVYPPLP